MIDIDVIVRSNKWNSEQYHLEKFIKENCEKIILLTDLKKILTPNFALELSISLVCDQQMKKINCKFRNKNSATNVLSFPSLPEEMVRKLGIKKLVADSNYLFLGDIVFSFETIKREAKSQRKEFLDHILHLLTHAILHLIGHDHHDEKMAESMENLEIKILKKLKVKNPYLVYA